MKTKKKIEVKVIEKKVPVVKKPSSDKLVVGNVTHHLDRRDGGTNWNESPKLPSLNDQS